MSEKDEKQFITLDEIVNAEAVYDLHVEALGKWVKIKNASTNDRLEAEKNAMKHPSWPLMTNSDKIIEVAKMLSLQILMEPKITYEEYKNSDDITMQVIISAVASEYELKIAKLTEQNAANLKRFLEQILGEEVMNSLNSLNSLTTISPEPVKSGEE